MAVSLGTFEKTFLQTHGSPAGPASSMRILLFSCVLHVFQSSPYFVSIKAKMLILSAMFQDTVERFKSVKATRNMD